MTSCHIAQLNVGVLQAPLDSPQLADFVAALGQVNAIADVAPGFVWRLRDAGGNDATSLRPRGSDLLVNMSVWASLEARARVRLPKRPAPGHAAPTSRVLPPA